MTLLVLVLPALLFATRLHTVHRLWRLPLKNGEGFFIAQRVGPDFYRAAGVRLFRRYHISLLVPLLLDVPLVVWFVWTKSYEVLALEQLLAVILSMFVYNLMVVHFSARATPISGIQEDRPATSMQLAIIPRRLRDYAIPAVEGVVITAILVALGLLAYSYLLSRAPGANHHAADAFRGGVVFTAWILYWQIGLLLIKGVFIRWRMPLPVNRTEDFRRWRMAWLSHNLKIFDAGRLLCALSLLAVMLWTIWARDWPRTIQIIILVAAALGMLIYGFYIMRESRRLAAAQREMKPIEMVKEFPRWPIAEGRYLAGGLLYFNRDNPWILVRSAQGVALNLAHRTIYAGTAYFLGLIALVVWMFRITH